MFPRRRSLARPWIALMGALLALAAPRADAQTFTAPTEISGGVAGGLPLIAVDTKGDINVAWSNNQGIFLTRSTDHGSSFTPAVSASAGATAGTLQMNLDQSGRIYLLWQDANLHFMFSRSDDGVSFSNATDLTAALNLTAISGNSPSMAVDTNGAVDLAWAQFGSPGKIFFSRSGDAGKTFSAPATIGSFRYAARTQISIGSTGQIFLLWLEETTQAGTTCALRFNGSSDGGVTFSPAAALNVADTECDPKLLVDAADNVSVLSFDASGTYYRSANGTTFSTSENIFQPMTVWFGGQLISPSPNEIVTIANSFPNHDIVFSKSVDQGRTFSSPLPVSVSHPAPVAGGAFGGNDQSIAIDSSGKINVIWDDDVLNPGAPDVFFSRSTDGGAHFSTAQNVSLNPGSGSPRMGLDSAGNVNVVWASANGGKVWFSRAAASTANAFTMSAAPSSLTVLPGGSATTQLTLTSTGASGQPVNLSCSNLPPGAQCLFNPPTVTPGTSGTFVTVTLTVAPTFSASGFPFTIHAVSPTISQFQSMQVNVGSLTGSVTPSATTIPLGGAANFVVTVAGSANFAGQFQLTCGAPPGVTCTFTPSSAFLPINGRASATLSVQVFSLPASGSVVGKRLDVTGPLPGSRSVTIWSVFCLMLAVPAFAALRRKCYGSISRASSLAAVSLTLALAGVMLSCGGSTTRSSLAVSSTTGGVAGASGFAGTGGVGGTTGSAGAGGSASGGVNVPGSTSVTFPLTVFAQSGGAVIAVGTVAVTVP